MLIKHDLSEIIDNPLIGSSWAAKHGYVYVPDPIMENTIRTYYPDIELEFDEDGNLINITTDKEPEPTTDEKIAALKEENQMLIDCILEMSEIVYGGDF